MAIKIKKINNLNNVDEKIKSNIKDNFFLDQDWLKLISKVFNLESVYLEIEYNRDLYYFVAHIQKDIILSPFIGYAGIINPANLSDKELLEIFLEIEVFTGYKIKRVKMFPNVEPDNKFFKKNIHVTAILEIESDQFDQEKKYKKVVRNSVNYAKRSGVEVKTIGGAQIEDFYSIYSNTMKRVGSEYMTPKVLFEKMSEMKNVSFLGAYVGNELIAGSVFMRSGDFMFYWWNSSNEKGRDLCANYLLIDSAIKLARTKGNKYIDMASSNNDRIERGKLLWGSNKIPFFYFDFN